MKQPDFYKHRDIIKYASYAKKLNDYLTKEAVKLREKFPECTFAMRYWLAHACIYEFLPYWAQEDERREKDMISIEIARTRGIEG